FLKPPKLTELADKLQRFPRIHSVVHPVGELVDGVYDATLIYPRLQGWGMFAPNPITDDGSLTVDALTIDGRHTDPFPGAPPARRPANPDAAAAAASPAAPAAPAPTATP